MKVRKPSVVVAVAAAAVVFSAGGAYAYWVVTGAGKGTATVASVKPLEIKQTEVKGLTLGRAVELKGKVTNRNDFEASLIGTHLSVKTGMDPDHRGCDLSNFVVVVPTIKATTIPAGGSADFGAGLITMLNTNSNQAPCQGATVTLDYLLK